MSRIDQINEVLRAELATLISRESPVMGGLITILRVKCSPDLRYAKIFISVLPEGMSGSALEGLRRNNSSYSGVLKKKLNLKFIPKFNWVIDQQERYAISIDKALGEIYQEESEK